MSEEQTETTRVQNKIYAKGSGVKTTGVVGGEKTDGERVAVCNCKKLYGLGVDVSKLEVDVTHILEGQDLTLSEQLIDYVMSLGVVVNTVFRIGRDDHSVGVGGASSNELIRFR